MRPSRSITISTSVDILQKVDFGESCRHILNVHVNGM